MGTQILLKFMRLANAVMYIHTSAEFILTSFAVANDAANPDIGIVDMTRMWNVYVSSGLHLVDNLSVLCIICDMSSLTSLRAGIRSTFTGRIRLRCGSLSTQPVRSRFHSYALELYLSAGLFLTTSNAHPDEHLWSRLVLRFTLRPPDRSQLRAARHVVLPSFQQHRDAHRLGQSPDQHSGRKRDNVTYYAPRRPGSVVECAWEGGGVGPRHGQGRPGAG